MVKMNDGQDIPPTPEEVEIVKQIADLIRDDLKANIDKISELTHKALVLRISNPALTPSMQIGAMASALEIMAKEHLVETMLGSGDSRVAIGKAKGFADGAQMLRKAQAAYAEVETAKAAEPVQG